jgi:hypothetical protein
VSNLAGTLGIVIALGLSSVAAAQEKSEAGRTAALVNQLGSQIFAEREQAARALDALGPAALNALHQAARHQSLEVRRRARDLIRKIERRAETARLLRPARVRLAYKDTPVPEAVADLMTQTGLTLKLEGDSAVLARRKLTLDTGEVPVWEAFDLFCRKAGLAEVAPPIPAAPTRSGGVSVTVGGGFRAGGVVREPVDVLGKESQEEPVVLTLRDGAPSAAPAHRSGSMRVRALAPVNTWRNLGGVLLHLDVTTDASLRCQEIVNVRLARAVDDQGKPLSGRLVPLAPDPALTAARGLVVINGRTITVPDEHPKSPARLAALRFEPGAKPPKSLKELTGTLLARVQSAPEILVTIPDVHKAAGKKYAGPQGTWVHVHEVRREGEDVTLRFEVAPPPQDLSDGAGTNEPILNVMINGKRLGEPDALLSSTNFELLDAKGRALQATRAVYTGKHTATAQEYELTYQAGDAAALRLVYRDRRSALIEVPFTLKDVPLR